MEGCTKSARALERVYHQSLELRHSPMKSNRGEKVNTVLVSEKETAEKGYFVRGTVIPTTTRPPVAVGGT